VTTSLKTSAEVTRQAAEITRLITTRKRWRNRRGKPKHLKVLEAFETSQSPGDPTSNSQLEHLKERGVNKSRDDWQV